MIITIPTENVLVGNFDIERNVNMAKSLTYKKTTTEKVSIKGVLSADAKEITIVEDKEEKVLKIQDYLDKFASMAVEFTIGCKDEEDLSESEE